MPTVGLDNGKWFDTADSRQWVSMNGVLYLVAEQWVVRDAVSSLLDLPGKAITPSDALAWLTSAGHDVPDILQNLSETTRLR